MELVRLVDARLTYVDKIGVRLCEVGSEREELNEGIGFLVGRAVDKVTEVNENISITHCGAGKSVKRVTNG